MIATPPRPPPGTVAANKLPPSMVEVLTHGGPLGGSTTSLLYHENVCALFHSKVKQSISVPNKGVDVKAYDTEPPCRSRVR